jgi:glucan phosphoethanolaminetransferase (alkaline phosphatase superfamily)
VKYRLILFFCILSLLLSILWQRIFHLPLLLIPIHFAVAAASHIIVLTFIATIYRYVPSRALSIFLIGVWTFVVLLFYLLIFGSMHFWGDIVTVKILGTYFQDFNGFLHSLPFSYGLVITILSAFILLPFAIVFIFSIQIDASLKDLWTGIAAHKKLLLPVLVVLLLCSPLLLKAKRFIHIRGEPLMVMLFDHMWGVTDNPLFTPRRIRVGVEDSRIRRAYATNEHLQSRKNVILIIVDALRADHLSAYGYQRKTSPFLDALIDSSRAIKIGRCYSTCSNTLCGVTSILLSRTWNETAVNGFNIIGLLRDQGYQTHALISGAHKEWYNMAKFYSDDCQYYDGKESKKYYFKDDRVLLEGMEGVHTYSDTPAFFYFHLQSTHETGLLQDKYTVYKPFKKSITTQGMNGQAAINEYDDKVLQADDIIRQLFDVLDEKGYLKNSMVIITADHGQGLGEHGVSGHVDWLYEPQISVPLIIYDDSLSLYKNRTIARQIDIAPTITDRLGLPEPASWMGLSLINGEMADRYSYHETGKNGLETGQQKYMLIWSGRGGPSRENKGYSTYKYIFTADLKQEELYNVTDDPGEKINLATIEKDNLETMRSKAKLEMKSKFGND